MGKPIGKRHNRHIDYIVALYPNGPARKVVEADLLDTKSPRQIAKLYKKFKKKVEGAEARAS